jgi:hypothetical protein
MKGAALILKVRDTMMVVRIRGSTVGVTVVVCGDRHCLVDVERVLVNRWNNAEDLGEHEEPKQTRSQPADCSCVRHAIATTASSPA